MKRATAPERGPAPQSVDRIFAVLDHLAAEPAGDTLAGIARRAQAPKTSMVGLLAGMVAGGYVARDGKGQYTLGPSMLTLAMRVAAKADIVTLARPILMQLVSETDETALLGTLAPDGDVSMYIDKVESTNPLRYTVSLGERRELYSSAIGKLLLAYMEKPARERYLRRVRPRAFTANTITSVARLREEVELIARRGISSTNSERIAGASAIAAPVLDAHGQLVVGICLAGPTERVRARHAGLEGAVRESARRLTALLAGREPLSDP